MDDSGWIMADYGGWVDYSTGVDGGGGMAWDRNIVDGLTSSFTEHFTCLGETAGPAPHHPRGKGKDHG